MSTAPIRPLRSMVPLAAGAALVLAAAVIQPVAAAGADLVLIEPPVLVRRFPDGFCPLPITLTFISSGNFATFHAEANIYAYSSFLPPAYTQMGIDNVALVPTATHALYSAPIQYVACNSVNALKFQDIPAGTVPLIETFESGTPNWDLQNGAYHDATRSAPLVPPVFAPFTPGAKCLGLGVETTPSPDARARTSITVGGLTEGVSYTLSFWWIASGPAMAAEDAKLWLKVTGPDPTAARRSSWGTLKIRYH